MNKILISKNHSYAFYYSNPENLENFEKKTLNLLLKYERLFADLPDGQIKDFFNIEEATNVECTLINLLTYDDHLHLFEDDKLDVRNLIVIDKSHYSESSKKAAFCIFGWDQVYVESV